MLTEAGMLCNTDTSIMKSLSYPTCVSDTRVGCNFKNLPHVHMSCPYQHCHVHATTAGLVGCRPVNSPMDPDSKLLPDQELPENPGR